MITNLALLDSLDDILKPQKIKDYCPNGLQVEGKKSVNKIVTGVTASLEMIDAAVDAGADALLVHHGYFWRGEDERIIGMKQRRVKQLLRHDINLFGYHLPLDIHPTLGNNSQLASLLNIEITGTLEPETPQSVVMCGELRDVTGLDEMARRVSQTLQRVPTVVSGGNHAIRTIAWCTGGGQNYIELAAKHGIDLFITGEASEQTYHVAKEMNIHFIAAGHHATERYGVKALGKFIAEKHDIEVEFIDINNPI